MHNKTHNSPLQSIDIQKEVYMQYAELIPRFFAAAKVSIFLRFCKILRKFFCFLSSR